MSAFLVAGPLARAELAVAPIDAPTVGRSGDFRISGVSEVSNPFDPDQVAVDATFVSPGGATRVIPGFYYQSYTRQLTGTSEALTRTGDPEWRARFLPTEPGTHTVALQVRRPGQSLEVVGPVEFQVSTGEVARVSVVGISTNRQYFVGSDGAPRVLVGHCACWPGGQGTYDYDDWFAAMESSGENYTRLWMCPWAFGIENPGAPVTRYALDRAWQLDHVFREAERRGIHLLLCLDYHGMFETEPDYWGGNNYWTNNPYTLRWGGPCTNPNDFFKDPTARSLYQKRLRYLVGRYGSSPSLLGWQFFNEIDNVYRWLNPADVADWHRVMGEWIKAQDPYHHLVTTSLGSGGDRPELWSLPAMDFVVFHSYGQPDPALGFSARCASLFSRYGKPVLIGEFGMNWQGWFDTDDPYRRGFRQGVWAGVLGGSAGTAMSWWWEKIEGEHLYPVYRTVADFVGRSGLGRGRWEAAPLAPASAPPVTVGAVRSGEPEFSATLALDNQWGARPGGRFALPVAEAASGAAGALASFVHGSSHVDLKTPFQVNLWLGTNGVLVLHLNSVSQGAIMNVRVDGTNWWSRSVPNLDGGYQVNGEYDTNFTVPLPAGPHTVEVRNTGADWYYLDWVRFDGVLPAEYAGGWTPQPVAMGLQGGSEMLLYVAHPQLKYPGRVTSAVLPPVTGAALTFTNGSQGWRAAAWFDAATGAERGVTLGEAVAGQWLLPVPTFNEDLVARVVALPRLSWLAGGGGFEVVLKGEARVRYALESTQDWSGWVLEAEGVSSDDGELRWPVPASDVSRFLRAVVR